MSLKLNKSNGFVGGALWLALSAMILKVIGVLYKIPLSYIIGDEGMGYFNSAYTVYTFFYIIGTAGMPKAISIVTARYEGEEGCSREVYFTAFKFFATVGFLLSAVFFAGAGVISRAIGSPRSYYSMLLIAPSVFFVCASGVARGFLSGVMCFSKVAVSELITGVFKLFLGLSLAYLSSKLGYSVEVSAALAILGITIGSFFGMLYLLLSVGGQKRAKGKHIGAGSRGHIREILMLTLPMTFASAISGLASIIDLMLVMNGLTDAGYSEVAAATLYGNLTTLAIPMFSLVATVITQFSSAALPIMTKSLSGGSREGYLKGVEQCMNATSFVVFPAFFAMLLFPLEILAAVFEYSSAVLGARMLAVLSPGVLFLGLLTVYNTTHEARGRVRLPVIALGVGAAVKLVISLVLIGNEAVGILAAPLGSTVGYGVSLIISAFGRLGERGSIASSNFPSAVHIISSFLAALASLFVKQYITAPYTRLKSLGILVCYGCIYLVLSYILHIKTSKKRQNMSKYTKTKSINY